MVSSNILACLSNFAKLVINYGRITILFGMEMYYLVCFLFVGTNVLLPTSRQQHNETMEEHIEKCIKSTASRRRLKIVYNLRASAIGTNPELCQSQATQTATLVLCGISGLESVLSSIITNALARFPGVEVAFDQVDFGRTPESNNVRLFLSGPADHLKGAIVKIQVGNL